jgi:hypothetical protein
MFDGNRILKPPIAIRTIGQDHEFDAGRRVGHRRDDRAVRLTVPARLRSISEDA